MFFIVIIDHLPVKYGIYHAGHAFCIEALPEGTLLAIVPVGAERWAGFGVVILWTKALNR
jgi:hypothetical protein